MSAVIPLSVNICHTLYCSNKIIRDHSFFHRAYTTATSLPSFMLIMLYAYNFIVWAMLLLEKKSKSLPLCHFMVTTALHQTPEAEFSKNTEIELKKVFRELSTKAGIITIAISPFPSRHLTRYYIHPAQTVVSPFFQHFLPLFNNGSLLQFSVLNVDRGMKKKGTKVSAYYAHTHIYTIFMC